MLRQERGMAVQTMKDDSHSEGKKKTQAQEKDKLKGKVDGTDDDAGEPPQQTMADTSRHAVATVTRPATAPTASRTAHRKPVKRRMASTKGRVSPVISDVVPDADNRDGSSGPRKGHFLARVKQGMAKFVSFRRGSDAMAGDSTMESVVKPAAPSSSSASGSKSLSSSVKGTSRPGAAASGRTTSLCVHPGLPTLRYDWSHRMSTNAHLTREEQNRQGTRLKTQTSYMAKMAAHYENVFECYGKHVREQDARTASDTRRHTCPPAPNWKRRDQSTPAPTPRDAAIRVRERLRRLSRTEGHLTSLGVSRSGSATRDDGHEDGHDNNSDNDGSKDNTRNTRSTSANNSDCEKGANAGDHGDGDDVFDELPVHPPSPLRKLENGCPPMQSKLMLDGGQRRGSSFAGWSSSQRQRQRQGGDGESKATEVQQQLLLKQQRAKSMHEPRRRPSYHPWPSDWDPSDCDSAMVQRRSVCIPPPSITRQ